MNDFLKDMVYGENEMLGNINDSGNVYLYQDSDGSDNWNSNTYNELYNFTHFRGYKIFENGNEIENKNHALGIIDLSDSEKGLTVGVNQFWQQFPKKLKVEGDGTITCGILPEDFTQDNVNYHWLEDMSQINTEIFYHFHIGAYNQSIRDDMFASQRDASPADPHLVETGFKSPSRHFILLVNSSGFSLM